MEPDSDVLCSAEAPTGYVELLQVLATWTMSNGLVSLSTSLLKMDSGTEASFMANYSTIYAPADPAYWPKS